MRKIPKGLMVGVWLGMMSQISCQKSYQVAQSGYSQYVMDDSLAVDSSLIRYYLPYKRQMQAEMDRVIGHSAVAITGGKGPETLLGNFFSEAILDQGRKFDPSIQFTFATRGGLRNTLPKGALTIGNIFELMPFENEMVVLKLSGDTTWKLLEYIAASKGQPVAGLRMYIDGGKPTEILIGGKAFDPKAQYTILTYDYLVNSGGDLSFLSEAQDQRLVGKRLRDALIDYVEDITQQGNEIQVQLDDRIRVNENE
ncbi:5'-nucleotidase-like protein [Dyadobacter jejuensis]|uniref:5'-nucleotidase-like protein n=2 Tax=Dyadobacter jejuensis TaxID=1082580 RepID=A0A316AQM9_9BACT|nr:5'-nucleotidase-like protein [Dyadobacter jejuensis]